MGEGSNSYSVSRKPLRYGRQSSEQAKVGLEGLEVEWTGMVSFPVLSLSTHIPFHLSGLS